MNDEMDEIIADFISEAEETLDKIDPLFVELEAKGQDKKLLNEIFRSVHTLKGAAGFLGFRSIVGVAHSAENILKKLREDEILLTGSLTDVILKSVDMLRRLIQHIKLKDGKEEVTTPLVRELDKALKSAQKNVEQSPLDKSKSVPPPEEVTPNMPESEQMVNDTGQTKETSQTLQTGAPDPQTIPDTENLPPEKKEAIQTLRVEIDRIDKVMDLTGEVVLIRNRLLNIVNYLELKYSDDEYVDSLIGTVSFLDLVTSDMQLAVMKMRMQPLKKVFSRFPRVVRDMSKNLGKDVELNISGEDTEVDKSVIEYIGDPMVHIIRNSIDHGLESMEERQRRGKQAKGKINIAAYQQGNQIIIEVSDDGKGIDIERVKRKALEKSLISEEEAQKMGDESAINLIFLPGFSTVDVATELSGRGVGMDVVKTNISKLNGYVEVTTKKDAGTTFRISIPLTLAIIHALMVRVGDLQYAIPFAPIEETLRITENDVDNIAGQTALVVREKICPLFDLIDILGCSLSERSEQRYALVVTIGDRRFCIVVDELLGQEEVVIKTVEGIDTDSAYILGATITGDGKVVLILDLAGISRNVLGLTRM